MNKCYRMTLRCRPHIYKQVKALASSKYKSMTEVINDLLEKTLKHENEKK